MSDRNAPFERPPAEGSPTPDASDANYQAAQTAIAGFWQTALTNEESRFNNLNTRAVAVLTIAGLVTGIAGFFVKDIDTPSPNPLGGSRAWVAGCVAATVLALILMALIVIAKVLTRNAGRCSMTLRRRIIRGKICVTPSRSMR